MRTPLGAEVILLRTNLRLKRDGNEAGVREPPCAALRNRVLEQDGIRVLSVFVGRTATPMQAAVHAVAGRDYQPELLIQPEDVAAVVINSLNLPRTAEVTEISMRPFVKSY